MTPGQGQKAVKQGAMVEHRETMGMALLRRRTQLGIPQREAADHFEIGVATYSRWETDMELPIDRLADMKDWVGMSAAQFGRTVLASAAYRARRKARG